MTAISSETVAKRAVERNPHAMRKAGRYTRPTTKGRFQAYTVSQLLETYRDPRAVLLEIASMDTLELAKLANCTPLEALQERRLCATNVLPYVASKMPVDVTIKHTKAVHLNIVDPATYHELQVTAEQQDAPLQLVNAAQITEAELIEQDAEEGSETGVALSASRASIDDNARADGVIEQADDA